MSMGAMGERDGNRHSLSQNVGNCRTMSSIVVTFFFCRPRCPVVPFWLLPILVSVQHPQNSCLFNSQRKRREDRGSSEGESREECQPTRMPMILVADFFRKAAPPWTVVPKKSLCGNSMSMFRLLPWSSVIRDIFPANKEKHESNGVEGTCETECILPPSNRGSATICRSLSLRFLLCQRSCAVPILLGCSIHICHDICISLSQGREPILVAHPADLEGGLHLVDAFQADGSYCPCNVE